MSATTADRLRRGRTIAAGTIPIAAGLAFLALALFLVWTKPYPSDFDELEHVSYAAYLQESGEWRPMFEAMRTLPRDGLGGWDERANYLGHPAPFYWFETLFLDRSLPLGEAVVRVRLGSAALVAGGVGLALLRGWRRFARDRVGLGVFCALVALAPKLLAVAGQVSNDALAIGAGGLAYWGAGARGWRGLAACGAGLAGACWAKPNAGLTVGVALGLLALGRLRKRPGLAFALAGAAAVGSVPYGPIVAKYGALVPITVEQFGGVRQVPGAGYLPVFLFNVAATFGFDQTGAWPVPSAAAFLAAASVWALLGVAAWGGWRAWRGGGRLLPAVGPAAMLAVLPVHWWFSSTALGGSVPAASFRYYLPIWPFLAHAAAYAAEVGGPVARRTVVALAAAALVLGWVSP